MIRRGPTMKALTVLVALWIVVPRTIWAQSQYDRHNAFDNSPTDKSYFYSKGSSVHPSELELVDGKFPVEEAHYVSPRNSLRLEWRSQSGGDWQMTLQLRKHYRRVDFSGNSLSFWCYSDTDLLADESPLVNLQDANGE